MLSFGKFIRQKRLEKGYTLRRFAQMICISPTYISRMERDEIKPPGEHNIRKMADILKIDADELVLRAGKIPEHIKIALIQNPDICLKLRSYLSHPEGTCP